MKQAFSRTVCILLALVTALGAVIFVGAGEEATTPKQKITNVFYYDKNPDPNAGDLGAADYPAVCVGYEESGEGTGNLEVFVLKKVASKDEANNTDFGYEGFQIKGQWYRVTGLWTVNPASDIIDKGAGHKVLFTPVYYSETEKPNEGDKVSITLFDYDTGLCADPVEFTVPAKGGVAEVEVEDGACPHENTGMTAELKVVNTPVTVDEAAESVMIFKEDSACFDCSLSKTVRVTRLRFKSKSAMRRYLKGKKATLKSGRKVHFEGDHQKIERVYWNRKMIEVSTDYIKTQGSVVLEFTDSFFETVSDGWHEIAAIGEGEFALMAVKVEGGQMTEAAIPDVDGLEGLTEAEYDKLLKDCGDEGVVAEDLVPEVADVTVDEVIAAIDAIGGVDGTAECGERIADARDGYDALDDGDKALVTNYDVLEAAEKAYEALKTTRGDVNRDGKINAKDVTALMKYLVGVTVKDFDPDAADYDGNGKLNAKDVTALMKYLVSNA